MIALGTFDGCSCGQVAFNVAGKTIDKYYASEIDKYAMQVTQDKHPGTIQLGNIENWREWEIEQPDIIIGGSPCQGFSFAGKQLNFEDSRSKLFFTFIEILKHYNPKYFLLENVKMATEHNDVISRILGEIYPECIDQVEMFQAPRLEPILINSALVSAQNRERLYWTNIPGIEQPKDKGIMLKDIIENGEVDRDKSLTVLASVGKGGGEEYLKRRYYNGSWEQIIKCGRIVGRPIDNPKSRVPGQLTKQMFEIRKDAKTNCLSTVQKDNVIVKQLPRGYNKGFKKEKNKMPSLTCNSFEHNNFISTDNVAYRKLTPLECERLQTLPDNYTLVVKDGKQIVSNSQRYKMIGNGWTVDVIAHIFKNLP